jgi:hypothetical protein
LQQVRERGLTAVIGEVVEFVKSWSSRRAGAGSLVAEEDNNARLWRTLNSRPTLEYLAGHPTYSGRSIVVRARQAERPGFNVAPDLGWSRLLTGSVTVADAPGDHLGLINKAETAEHIIRFSAEAATRQISTAP